MKGTINDLIGWRIQPSEVRLTIVWNPGANIVVCMSLLRGRIRVPGEHPGALLEGRAMLTLRKDSALACYQNL
jgi:hypothetical protein